MMSALRSDVISSVAWMPWAETPSSTCLQELLHQVSTAL